MLTNRIAAFLAVASIGACSATTTPAGIPTVTSSPTVLSQTTTFLQSPASSSSPSVGSIDLAALRGKIAFSGGGRHAEDVYIVEPSGGSAIRVTTDPASDFDPSWSPDGKRLAYRHQDGLDPTSEIWVIGTDGSEAHNVSDMPETADWGPSWSPKGDVIAWNSQGAQPLGFGLALVAPDGSGVREVPVGRWVEYPAWSPDGTQIAFMSQQPDAAGNDPNYDIFVIGGDGSGLRQLTDFPGEDGFPSWSPNGSLIAFSSTRDDCRHGSADCRTTGDIGPYQTLYVVHPDGTGLTRVSLEEGMFVDWSPDGRYLVTNGRGGLRVTALDGSATAAIPVSVAEPGFPDWLP